MSFVQRTWHFSIAFRKTNHCHGSRRWLSRAKTLQFHRVWGVLVRVTAQTIPVGPTTCDVPFIAKKAPISRKWPKLIVFKLHRQNRELIRATGESVAQTLGRRAQEWPRAAFLRRCSATCTTSDGPPQVPCAVTRCPAPLPSPPAALNAIRSEPDDFRALRSPPDDFNKAATHLSPLEGGGDSYNINRRLDPLI